MAKRRDYGFVRSYASLGSDTDDIEALVAAGYAGVLFDYNDPKLDQAVRDAQAKGISYGFWGDPNAVGNDNAAYVSRMQRLNQQYRPDLLVPDLEFAYRGAPGSAEWNKMADLARLWQQAMPGVRTAVAPMGNPFGMDDYNIEAWGKDTEWLPQAYGADSNAGGHAWDPQGVVETLIRRGVPPEMISPILAAAHGGQGYGGSSLWTVDDFIGKQIPKASGPVTPSPNTGGPVARTTSSTNSSTTPGRNKPTLSYLGQGYSQGPARIEQKGLQWFGKTFGNEQAFAKELQARGQNYAAWAASHQPAAQALQGR